jgi:hypothetical protein
MGGGAKAPLLHSLQKLAPQGPSRDLVYVEHYSFVIKLLRQAL